MIRKSRHWAIGAAIAVVCGIGTRLLDNVPFFQVLNLKALDTQFILRGRTPTSNIMLLVADDKALNAFHEPQIFWHPYYAQAIKAAGEAGARVIGLDLAFGIPVDKWEPDHDRVLAEAVSTTVFTLGVPVVCGYVEALNANQETLPIQINMISAAMGLSAFVNMTTDPDDFLRRQELVSADVPPDRSFGMRVAEKYLGQDATFQSGRLALQGHNVPIAADRSIFINYAGPAGTFPRVSLADFIAAARAGESGRLRSWVKGKIVLIGTDSMADRLNTPFFGRFSGSRWNTAGVEIHANTIRTILERRYLVYAPEWAHLAGLLLASIIAVFIVTELAARRIAVALLIECLGTLALTHILFRTGLILSASEMLITVTLSGIGATVYRLATAESRRNLFRKAIALFVGHQLATELEQAQGIHLSGKRRYVTIMFTDIRGFTAFAEKVSAETGGPETLVQMLNEYMKVMVAIIHTYGGHVNKFIGDGILAVFSDDDKGAVPGDHAVRAVQCAVRMVMAPSRFETGAGIHTGFVVIGNVGSTDKMEYTVLGDTVNLASRLESLNKEHKTRLLMSETTCGLLGNRVETAPIGTVMVRGKTAPITLYSVPSTLVVVQKVSRAAADV